MTAATVAPEAQNTEHEQFEYWNQGAAVPSATKYRCVIASVTGLRRIIIYDCVVLYLLSRSTLLTLVVLPCPLALSPAKRLRPPDSLRRPTPASPSRRHRHQAGAEPAECRDHQTDRSLLVAVGPLTRWRERCEHPCCWNQAIWKPVLCVSKFIVCV